ncbi:MAG: DeoR family transcriptional regulator [Candidatus Omnitrophica bacterium]|nr:DeoR family transcriptional regulator [Candidatus Omnitrophota bacterium]
MVRSVDYDNRRKAILAATIKQYINEALPISSEDICESFDLSSATIRNIFAELEGSGYLAQPHTSAGRVPTSKGYRYYVDFLLSQLELMDEEKERIINEYQHQISRMEDALELTSEVLSQITHYASIVSFLEWHDKFFYRGISSILEEPEFQDVGRMRALIKMLEEKERLLDIINRDFKEKVKVYIGQELGFSEMEGCALAVSNYSLKNRPLGRIAVLGPARMKYDRIIPALEYISNVLEDVLGEI